MVTVFFIIGILAFTVLVIAIMQDPANASDSGASLVEVPATPSNEPPAYTPTPAAGQTPAARPMQSRRNQPVFFEQIGHHPAQPVDAPAQRPQPAPPSRSRHIIDLSQADAHKRNI